MTNESTDQARWNALLELRWHLDAQAEEQGWDLPPQLLSLHALTCDGHPGVGATPVPGWSYVLDQAGHVRDALWALTQVFSDFDTKRMALALPSAPVLGVVLTCESWMTRDEQALAEGQRPSSSPHRVETRCITVATPTTHATLIHERDGIANDLGATDGALPILLMDFANALSHPSLGTTGVIDERLA
jgi:hypothetical protein